MQWKNGYFYNDDGSRYLPLGQFACYFRTDHVGEELVADSQHGNSLIEFQHATRSVWQRLFRYFAEEDGCTMIRMFPRGDSGGSAWEGLDIGGRVNHALLAKIKAYLAEARPYGIKLQLCLFTEPECSFYCQRDTRTYWGRRLWTPDEIRNAAPSQRRFLENPDDIVSYDDFFSDPDVRDCCHRFLDELIPQLTGFEDLFSVEIFNESGWASPHADPMNTFRWEDTPAYLDWHRDMADHIRRLAPELPLCISNPGVSILGHDTVHWCREIDPDFFSLHNYPDICGSRPGIDYAAICDMALQYTAAERPTMMGEWQAIPVRRPHSREDERILTLLSRDTAWLTLLSGAPGCVAWLASGYGQYHAVREVFAELDGYPLKPSAPLVIDLTEAQRWFEEQWKTGAEECIYPAHRWCPDRTATDGGHRFCIKSESTYYKKLLDVEQWSLETGIPFRFALGEGVPLMEVTEADFAAHTPVLAPVAGYQQKAMTADDGRVKLVFLRNYVSKSYMVDTADGGQAENFSLRTQKTVPVVLNFREPDPSDRVRLYDLENRKWMEIDPTVPLGLGVTDHDFVVLIEQR